MRAMEPLLNKHKVAITVAGHVHGEREDQTLVASSVLYCVECFVFLHSTFSLAFTLYMVWYMVIFGVSCFVLQFYVISYYFLLFSGVFCFFSHEVERLYLFDAS